ncbi:MAG: hypothetical protein PHV23_03160 [Candidatus Gracilibacteria bacterium]|nr:hypothetical protein [Candidatus Gracilibacteria bacterium]
MKNNKKAFGLIIAMGLVLISSLLAFTILEFIVPFSKNIKGIENSTKSYYMANSGIESGLFFFSNRTGTLLRSESSRVYTGNYDYAYTTSSSGTTIPLTGKGNSDFDKDWNTIGVSDPIQLSIGYGFANINTLRIDFRVPNLDGVNATTESLSGSTIPMVNWQLTSPNDTLNSLSGTVLNASQVNGADIPLLGLSGKKVSDSSTSSLLAFFTSNNCDTTEKCILKFSIVNDLKTTGGISFPYLEWKLTSGINKLPLRYSTIESEGKSTGFVKKIQVRVPQETVSEAFDFTVFQ